MSSGDGRWGRALDAYNRLNSEDITRALLVLLVGGFGGTAVTIGVVWLLWRFG